jgi:hypothetical protein
MEAASLFSRHAQVDREWHEQHGSSLNPYVSGMPGKK